MTEQSNVVEIPLEQEGEAVTIDLDHDLPENPAEICALLENENCAPEYWLAIGTGYARNSQVENAVEVICRGLKWHDADESKKGPLYSCLSWLYLLLLGSNATASSKTAANSTATATNNNTNNNKANYLKLATETGNNAYAQDRNWSVNVLVRGAICLVQGKYDQALPSFQTVLTQSNNANLFAQLGKARVLYAKRQYKQALACYQAVLVAKPKMVAPDPRIGVGLCFWALGDKPMALKAWTRSLELKETAAVHSLLGLWYLDDAINFGIKYLASDTSDNESLEFAQRYKMAIQHASTAYKLDPTNACAAMAIIQYLYARGDSEQVVKLTDKILESSESPLLKAQAHFWKARSLHAQGNHSDAITEYNSAIAEARKQKAPTQKMSARGAGGRLVANGSSSSTSVSSSSSASYDLAYLAQLGLAFAQLSDPDEYKVAQAYATFEDLIAKYPRSADACLFLGLILAERYGKQRTNDKSTTAKIAKAVGLLEKYLSLTDSTPQLEFRVYAFDALSKLYETQPDKALEALRKAKEQAMTADQDIKLMNNMGVLEYMVGNYAMATKYFEESGMRDSSASDGGDFENDITVLFNQARAYEEVDVEKAKDIYSKILDEEPEYIDARIRSAYLAITSGDANSTQVVDDLMADYGHSNYNVRYLYTWFLTRSRPKDAMRKLEQTFKHTLTKMSKHDGYALTGLGNVYLNFARESREEKKRQTFFLRSAELFDKALQIDPANAHAAQGVGILLVENKKPELAMHIFARVRETLREDPSVHINCGHCLAELKQFGKSIEAYEHAVRLLTKAGRDVSMLYVFLGRAWYARGMRENNRDGLYKALEYATKALEDRTAASTDLKKDAASIASLQFNVAFLQFQIADFIRRLPLESRTCHEIEKVSAQLDEAIETFGSIAKSPHPPFAPNELEQRALMGQNTLRKQLDRALDEQKDYDSKNKTRLEEAREKMLAELKEKEERARKSAELEAEREAMLAEERKALQKETEKWFEQEREREREREEERELKKRKTTSSLSSSKKRNGGIIVDSDEEEEAQMSDEGEAEASNDEAQTNDLFGDDE